MNDSDNSDAALATSQLDIISCGLGAAILLGLVFSIVKDKPPVELSSAQFILVDWWTGPANTDVELHFIVTPPNGPTEEFSPAKWFDLETGQRRPDRPGFKLDEYGDFAVIMKGAGTPPDGFRSGPSIWVSSPRAGEWKFQARYASTSGDSLDELLRPAKRNLPRVDVKGAIANHATRKAEELDLGELTHGIETKPLIVNVRK